MNVLQGHKHGLNDMSWRGDGKGFCTASNDCSIGIWDAETGAMVRRLREHADPVSSVRYGTQQTLLVCCMILSENSLCCRYSSLCYNLQWYNHLLWKLYTNIQADCFLIQ